MKMTNPFSSKRVKTSSSSPFNMKNSIGLALAGLLVCCALLAAGCTGTGEDTTTAPSEINFGYQPSTHQVAYMLAMNKGWWSETLTPYGITVDKTKNEFQFPTGAPEMQAMLAGQIDVAYVGAAPVISALANGLDAKIVAGINTQGSDLVVRPDLDYQSPADLKGLTIATFPRGTIQDTLLRGWLAENGIDPDTDVDIREMGPGDAITAMTAGQIDATFLPHPAPTLLVEDEVGKIVVHSGEMFKGHACCVVVVSGDLIRNHPEIVEDIIRTHIRATEYAVANPDEAAQTFSDYTKYDINTVKASFAEWDGQWISDPSPYVESTMDYVNEQASLGYIKKPLTQDEIFDLSFYEKVVA